MTAATLAYQIAPRLNAAGRLDDMTVGVRCLLSESPDEALALAKRLDALNLQRRAIESRMRDEALELVDAEAVVDVGELAPVVCLFREDWHEGVLGLVAARIKERCHRPVFAFAATEAGPLKGVGAVGRGVSSARRARGCRRGAPGAHQPLRRTRDGCGADARSRGLPPISLGHDVAGQGTTQGPSSSPSGS